MRAIALVALLGLPAAAQDITAGLTARLEFPATPRVAADLPVDLRITLTDALGGGPARNVSLIGWVRPADPANADCVAAVSAFRATRALPLGTVDLNGVLLVTLNEDASLGLIDPKLNLRSSNMVAAHRFDAMPAAIAADPVGMRVLASVGRKVLAIDAHDGRESVVVEDVTRAGDLSMRGDGGFWLANGTGLSLRDTAGAEVAHHTLAGQVHLRPLPDLADEVGAFSDLGGLLVAGQRIEAAPMTDAAFLQGGGIVTLHGSMAEMRFRDAPQVARQIPLGIAASRLAPSADGRQVVAYTPGGPFLAVIDMAEARAVQTIELDAPATVTEIAATTNALYLLSLDGGYVAVMQGDAPLRRIPLAGQSTQATGGRLLLPLAPAPRLLAVDPSRNMGWIIHDMPATAEIPPMETVNLRGGLPRAVHLLDRSLRETAPGVFETRRAFPAGPQELVLTTADAAGTSLCLPFMVEGEHAPVPRVQARLGVEALTPARAGAETRLRLRLTTLADRPLAMEATPFLIPSLGSGWRGQAVGQPADGGTVELRLHLPHAGAFALQPLSLPEGVTLVAVPVVEAAP